MYSYNELKAMLTESKENAKKAIAALLIQSDKKLSAAEIGAIVGVSTGTASNWLSQNCGREISQYVQSIDRSFRLHCKEETSYPVYVNPENPSDTISVKKSHNVYWIG